MKNIFIACLLLCSSLATSQSDLFVSNGSYVFVDGAAFTSGPTVAPLYVTDDVNLANNGFIYLRNEAQLLQGNNVGNSGVGRLSVYQTGNSNTYQYNYWCSPVGINAGAVGNTDFRPNNILFGETAAPITSALATYVSAPNYDGVASSPPVIADFWFYSFTGLLTTPLADAYQDWVAIPTGGNLLSGYGFTMKGNPSGAQQYDFRGRPNNGTITVTLNANRETLVGNPYPSALDAYYFIHDPLNTGIADNPINAPYTTGVLKYWEQAPGSSSHVLSNYVGGYAHYTIATDNDNGTPSDLTDDTVLESFVPATFRMYLLDGSVAAGPPAGTGVKVARRYIPVGQGFMIEGNTTGTITFRNSQRSFYKKTDASSDFFRNANPENNTNASADGTNYTEEGYNIVPQSLKRFRINIGFDNNGNDSFTRQLLMNLHDSATDGFDFGFEAKGGGDLDSDAHWILNNDPYVIQAFAYDETLRIPLIVKIAEQQLSRFSIHDVQNFDSNQSIYIYDSEEDIYFDLTEDAYEIILESGDYTNRFEIVFTPSEVLNVDDSEFDKLTIKQNNNVHQLSVLNPNGLDVKSIEVFDIAGKRMLLNQYDSISDRYELSTIDLSDAVYVVKVTSNSNVIKSEKIIVKN